MKKLNIEKGYIASPLNSPCKKEIRKNMKRAKEYAYMISKLITGNAFAIHSCVPTILDDTKPVERELALKWGREMLEISNALFVCGTVISSGMAKEIELANKKGIGIYSFPYKASRLHIVNVFRVNFLNMGLANEGRRISEGRVVPCISLK